MIIRRTAICLVLFSVSALVGCATSRSEIKLNTPAVEAAASVPTTGKVVVIRSVQDERVFEQAPRDASIPSLGFGGAAQATAEVKARAIGRKRNGYGKALGDVLLEDGQTVERVIRESLTQVLQQAGYAVVDAESAPASALTADVHIKSFWAWLRLGFWSGSVNTRIETDLDIANHPDTIHIATLYEERRSLVTDNAWIEVVSKALEAYRTQAAQELGGKL